MARDATATRSLLVAAAERLRSQGAELVVLDYHDPRSWARRACYRAEFLPAPDGANLTCRAYTSRARTSCESLASWYLTRGDTDLC